MTYLGAVDDGELVVVKLAAAGGKDRSRRNFVDAAGIELPVGFLATVLGRGSHDHRPYLIREYVDGLTMRALLAEDDRLGEATVTSIAMATLTALIAMHTRGFTHGNLSENNIVVTIAGVRLLDHGLGRRQGESRPTRADDMLDWAKVMAIAGGETGSGRVAAVVARVIASSADNRPAAHDVFASLVYPSPDAEGRIPSQRAGRLRLLSK